MSEVVQAALIVFTLRLVDITLYTLRIFMVVRGRKGMAWLFGFCQAFVFVNAMRLVLSDLGNWWKIFGYAAGFATGMILGMWVEGRLAIGYTHLQVISSRHGAEICEHLRETGCGVTEFSGIGRDGAVTILDSNILRKNSARVTEIIQQIDPDAFITAQAVRSVRRGFWGY